MVVVVVVVALKFMPHLLTCVEGCEVRVSPYFAE